MTDSVALTVDLGGTNLRVASLDAEGVIRHQVKIPTPKSPDAILGAMIDGLRQVRATEESRGARPLGIGVSTSGCVDVENGSVFSSSVALEGWSLPLAEKLEAACGLSTHVENDGNCVAIAEHAFGAARGLRHVIVLWLGTGIGAGLIIDGRIHHGRSGAAAELGHVVVKFDGPTCSCGRIGCVESYASGLGIAARAARRMRAGDWTLDGIDAADVTARHLAEAAAAGHAGAIDVAREGGHALGAALGGWLNIFNPERVVLGGTIVSFGDAFLEPLHAAVNAHALPVAGREADIVLSTMHEPALLGASRLVFVNSA